MAQGQHGVEQVALSRLLDNAYEEFSQALHSVGARFVLWGSFKGALELQQHYFSAKDKKHLLDGRRSRSLSQKDLELKELVEELAQEAEEFATWALKQDRQPILREMLTSYCAAFEACLKNVALVFALAERKKQGLDDQVFVPGDEFRKTLRSIQDQWIAARGRERSTAETFFESQVLSKEAIATRFSFLSLTAPEWVTCRAAFQARNALVHQLGRPSESIEIAGECHHAGWEIQLTTKQLQEVRRAFLNILEPVNPVRLDLI